MNLKKIFTMTAIGSMVVAGLMLIAALFGIFDLRRDIIRNEHTEKHSSSWFCLL